MAKQVHPQSDYSTWVAHAGAEKVSKREGGREKKCKEQGAAEENWCALTPTS